MRRGVLLFAAVPVVATVAVYFLAPSDSGGSSARLPAGAAATDGTAAGAAREEAKDRAEREREQERKRDDAVIAGLPAGLADPEKKELAQRLVASAENSTLDWRGLYGSIEDLGDGQGYTAGIAGFCTGTHDLLTLVERYTDDHPGNGLARYLPALRQVDGTDSHEGLDPGFTAAWRAEAEVPAFRTAQERERDRVYFDPAVRLAKLDGLAALGQFAYYDAIIFHGPDTEEDGFYALRERAMARADTPAEGGDEKTYLAAFLDVRREALLRDTRTHHTTRDTTRVDTAQRRFLAAGNLELATPLEWQVYGDTYRVP